MTRKQQADPINFERVRDDDGEPWDRAHGLTANIAERPDGDVGEFVVQLPDGDPHALYLVEDEGDFFGFCTCKGYIHHFSDDDGACAHLCSVRKRHVLRDVIPDVAAETDEDDDADVDEEADDQGAGAAENAPTADRRHQAGGSA